MVAWAANVALHSRTTAGGPRPRVWSQETPDSFWERLENVVPPLNFGIISNPAASVTLCSAFPRGAFLRIIKLCPSLCGNCPGPVWSGHEASWTSTEHQMVAIANRGIAPQPTTPPIGLCGSPDNNRKGTRGRTQTGRVFFLSQTTLQTTHPGWKAGEKRWDAVRVASAPRKDNP